MNFDNNSIHYYGIIKDKSLFNRKTTKILTFDCLTGAISFGSIIKQTKSLIICSGTLSPLEPFASELSCSFQYKFEGSYVCTKEQFKIISVKK